MKEAILIASAWLLWRIDTARSYVEWARSVVASWLGWRTGLRIVRGEALRHMGLFWGLEPMPTETPAQFRDRCKLSVAGRIV